MVEVRQDVQGVKGAQAVKGARAVPEGRYGRERGPRGVKITGGVLGALLLALVVWIGVSYVSGKDVSGEMIKFKVVSDSAVEVHLEVRKDADAEGVCTLRALSEDGGEVGRKSVTYPKGKERVDSVITLRATSRATAAELVGCETG